MDDVRIKKNDHLGTPYLLIVLLHHIPMLLCSPTVVLVSGNPPHSQLVLNLQLKISFKNFP